MLQCLLSAFFSNVVAHAQNAPGALQRVSWVDEQLTSITNAYGDASLHDAIAEPTELVTVTPAGEGMPGLELLYLIPIAALVVWRVINTPSAPSEVNDGVDPAPRVRRNAMGPDERAALALFRHRHPNAAATERRRPPG